VRVPFGLLRYRRHFWRMIAGPGTLKSTAYRSEILCPEEEASYLPSLYLDGQLERIVGAPAESNVKWEIDCATKLSGVHRATIAYHFKTVALIKGSIYVDTLRFFLADDRHIRVKPTTEVSEVDHAALVSSYYGTKYFGHWLRDDCIFHVLADEIGIPTINIPTLNRPHADSYASLFEQDWTPTVRARLRNLTIFGDYSQNSLRLKQYQFLRERVAKKFPRGNYRSFVYLKRGKLGQPRYVQNEEKIIQALARLGFVVLDSGTDSVDAMLAVLVNAKLVISIEGSHISHCVYAIPGDSALLVLQPADRFVANHREWSNCLGIRFGFAVGAAGENGYLFDEEEILRTIDLLVSAAR